MHVQSSVLNQSLRESYTALHIILSYLNPEAQSAF